MKLPKQAESVKRDKASMERQDERRGAKPQGCCVSVPVLGCQVESPWC